VRSRGQTRAAGREPPVARRGPPELGAGHAAARSARAMRSWASGSPDAARPPG
jgi:hypothetical protein